MLKNIFAIDDEDRHLAGSYFIGLPNAVFENGEFRDEMAAEGFTDQVEPAAVGRQFDLFDHRLLDLLVIADQHQLLEIEQRFELVGFGGLEVDG